MPTLTIDVFKGPSRRYRSVLTRADGVEVELDGGAYNRVGGAAGEVPHDIAHLIVEEELGLESGVWGVLAAGGLFRGASVKAGRRRPHAAQYARELLEASIEQLNQAEILTRAVCDLAVTDTVDLRALRTASGPRWWPATATESALDQAVRRLRQAGEQWSSLDAGESLRFTWSRRPDRTVRPRRRR
jgi:hypothetical protein